MQSSLPQRADLDLIDTTQASNPPPSIGLRFMLAARRFGKFIRHFERQRPDFVLLFAAVGASLVEKGIMAWYARLRGVPAALFLRGGSVLTACAESVVTRTWVRLVVGGARMVLCQGPAWQRFAVHVLGYAPAEAPIIPNWTATPALLRIGQVRVPSERGPVRLLFVGWLDREKGVLEMLDAVCRISQSRAVSLEIVGEGNVSAIARELVRTNALDSVVRFSGWLHGADLERALADAHVLVLPSWAEGLPNAMIEAMAARLAVVVTAVGNVPDVVTTERDALLVPPRDVNALVEALSRMVDDPVLRHRIAEGGHALAAREFGVEPAVDRLLAATDWARRRWGGSTARETQDLDHVSP